MINDASFVNFTNKLYRIWFLVSARKSENDNEPTIKEKKGQFPLFSKRNLGFWLNIQKIIKKHLTIGKKGRILLTTTCLKKVKMMRTKMRKTVKFSDTFLLLL